MKFAYVSCLVFAAAAQTTNYLSTVPVARDGYHPLPRVQASYELEKPDNSIVVAGMQITPTFPTGIQITCQNDIIKLQFNDSASAEQAITTWNTVDNLHFLINHEVQCHDLDETTAYQVGKLTLNGSQISVNFTPAELHNVIDEYDLNIAHVEQAGNKRSTTLKNLPIAINFADGKAVNPDIKIFGNDQAQLSCTNCFVDGNVNFEITASGTRLSLKDYKFTINGNMFATMDLDARVLAADNNFLKQVNLFTKSLDPVAVKGLFNFGPAIAFDAGVSYSVTENIDFVYGFEFNYDFGFTAVAHQKPTFTQTPKFKEHPLTVSKDIQVSVSAHLIPSIQMNLEVLKIFTLDASLPVDTSLGLEFDTGKFNTCPNGNFGVALISQTNLSFKVHGDSVIKVFKPFDDSFDIFNTGKLTLDTFCQKPKSPLATTTVDNIKVNPTTTLPVATIQTTLAGITATRSTTRATTQSTTGATTGATTQSTTRTTTQSTTQGTQTSTTQSLTTSTAASEIPVVTSMATTTDTTPTQPSQYTPNNNSPEPRVSSNIDLPKSDQYVPPSELSKPQGKIFGPKFGYLANAANSNQKQPVDSSQPILSSASSISLSLSFLIVLFI
ncbi:hypothetical protein HDV01_000814 [Terramyces sp. JEL0728]|nr:hypothetical protein HDV01_000814 [Terramyces sp. JEL0728]